MHPNIIPYQRILLFIAMLAVRKSFGTPSQGGMLIVVIIGAILFTFDRRELS
jgi:hypothetical protein